MNWGQDQSVNPDPGSRSIMGSLVCMAVRNAQVCGKVGVCVVLMCEDVKISFKRQDDLSGAF